MEVVSDILQPYKELVGTVAGIVTTGQMFSGSFICYDIYKQGNTKGTSIMVFIGGFIMWVYFVSLIYNTPYLWLSVKTK